MKQEDKKLLLRYLCTALPYGVIVQVVKYGKCYDEREKKATVDCKFVGINRCNLITDKDNVEHTYAKGYVSTPITVPIDDGDMKSLPYLRSMSSMTEEEKKEFDGFCVIDEFAWKGNAEIGYKNQAIIMSDAINWLLEKHFDFMGLIPMGLAIEVTKENNPYKIAEE